MKLKTVSRFRLLFLINILIASGNLQAQMILEPWIPVEGVITNENSLDEWLFTSEAGIPIQVSVYDPTNSRLNLNPEVQLYCPRGRLISEQSDDVLVKIDHLTDVHGTYTVRVRGEGSGLGSYQVRLFNPLAEGAVMLENGLPSAGNLSAGEMDVWALDGLAGDNIILSVTDPSGSAGNLNPRVRVYQPDGEELFDFTTNTVVSLDFVLDREGPYRVLVSGEGVSQGDYTIQYCAVPGTPSIGVQDDGGDLSSGNVATGNIPAGDMDPWYFEADAGDAIILTVVDPSLSSGNLNPRVRLYTEDGTKLFDQSHTQMVSYDITLQEGGRYLVLLSDSADSSGDYRVEYAKVPGEYETPRGDQGGELLSGEGVTGNISTGDMDQWTFTAEQGDTVLLNVINPTGNMSPRARIYSPDRIKLFDSSDPVVVHNGFVADESGQYLVIVSDVATNSGQYSIQFFKAPGDYLIPPGDHGGELTDGASSFGNISAGDIDAWEFSAAIGELVQLEVVDVQSSANFLNPRLQLWDPDNVKIYDRTSTISESFNFTADKNGTYLLVVTGDEASSGEYRIDYSKSLAPSRVSHTGTRLQNGLLATATLAVGAEDNWVFDATLGDHVKVNMHDLGGSSANDPRLRVISPEGVELANIVDGTTAIAEFNAPVTGTYLVVASDSDLNTSYNYGVELVIASTGVTHVAPDNNGGGIILNGILTTSNLTIGDYDQYTFTAGLGDHIHINMQDLGGSSAYDPRLVVYGPDGSLLVDVQAESAAGAFFAASQSGTYLVVLSDNNANSQYSYGLEFARAGIGGQHIAPQNNGGGELVNGLLNTTNFTLGDYDQWTFEADLGDHVHVNVQDRGGSSANDPRLRIYAPDGTRLIDIFDEVTALADFAAPQSGTYLVVLSDSNLNTAFSYGLEYAVAKVASIHEAPSNNGGGELFNGLLQTTTFTLGDYDQWEFPAEVGDRFILTLQDLGGSSANDPRLRLYAPDGTELVDTWNESTAFTEWLAPQTGVYLAIVGDFDLDSAYNYGIDFAKTSNLSPDAADFDAEELFNDLVLNGSLLFGEVDHWTFDALAGDVVSLTMTETTFGYDPTLRVIAPDGSTWFSGSGSSSVSVTDFIEQTGTYRVLLSDDNFRDGGNYSIELSNIQINPLLINPTVYTAFPGWWPLGLGQQYSVKQSDGLVKKVGSGWFNDAVQEEGWFFLAATTEFGSWILHLPTGTWQWVPLAADEWSWSPALKSWQRNRIQPN